MAAALATTNGLRYGSTTMLGISRSVGGVRGREAEGHERVEGVVAAALEPALRRGRVVGEPEAVEPGRLRGRGHRGDPGAGDEVGVVRVA